MSVGLSAAVFHRPQPSLLSSHGAAGTSRPALRTPAFEPHTQAEACCDLLSVRRVQSP